MSETKVWTDDVMGKLQRLEVDQLNHGIEINQNKGSIQSLEKHVKDLQIHQESSDIDHLAEKILIGMVANGKWWGMYKNEKLKRIELAYIWAEAFIEHKKGRRNGL